MRSGLVNLRRQAGLVQRFAHDLQRWIILEHSPQQAAQQARLVDAKRGLIPNLILMRPQPGRNSCYH